MKSTIRIGFLYALITAIVIGVFVFVYKEKPCSSPITFKIGKIDSGYNINRNNFLIDIVKASEIWNKALNKELFKYDANGSVTINLVYDYRQRAVELRQDIDKNSNVAQSVKDQYQLLINQFETKKKSYESAVTEFNRNVNNISKNEYISRRQQLENERKELNDLSVQINAYIDKYNILVRNINSKVDVANQTTGEIEEGLYTSDPETIDVFQYQNETELIRVLAHELGHAIGLDHNENPESIMYKLNKSNKLVLTEDDLKAIKEVCRVNL